jgi:hypothetical protein
MSAHSQNFLSADIDAALSDRSNVFYGHNGIAAPSPLLADARATPAAAIFVLSMAATGCFLSSLSGAADLRHLVIRQFVFRFD